MKVSLLKVSNVLLILVSLTALIGSSQRGFTADKIGADKGLYRDQKQDPKGLYREPVQNAQVETKLTLTKEQAEARLLENTNKSLELSKKFSVLVDKHLQLAAGYDVDAFRKNDDELNTLFEAMDANYLESRMIYDCLGLSADELAVEKKSIQDSKLFMYKSSGIFNLCFGRPLNSAQFIKLALNLSEHSTGKKEYEPDVVYYLGAALCWAADYKNAEAHLKNALTIGKGRPFTQLKAGEPVNLGGQNPFTAQQLATVFLAENQNSKAIDLLKETRTNAPSEEVRGYADALLAVAYALDEKRLSAKASNPNAGTSIKSKEHIANAKKELVKTPSQTFPAIAAEFRGIAEAVDGNYQAADKILSEAIPRLQDSPIKLGNRLEAAQASLWRSYCRERLGNKAGADEDLKYAMSFADEAPHLGTVAKMLDALFGKESSKTISTRPRQKWAMVVGLANFADPKIPRLKYPKKDAEDMAKFLVEHGGFQSDHIKTLVDESATKEQLLKLAAGDWLPSVSKPNDLVFLFISSHGTPAYEDIGAMNSVVTYDTRMDQLFSTSIPMQNIVRLLSSKLTKRHIFVVLDTCYAGGLGAPLSPKHTLTNVDPDFLLSSNYQILVSSSNGHERSWESKRYQNSVFTRQLIDTVASNRGYDRFQSVFPLIQKKVSEEVSTDHKGVSQTPTLSGMWSGVGLTADSQSKQ